MFEQLVNVSEQLGTEQPHRSYPFFLQKLIEEVGELSVELQIKDGVTPAEKGGSDGVLGEACDVINCAIDIAWRTLHEQHPNEKSDFIAQLILQRCMTKRQKWVLKVGGNYVDKPFEDHGLFSWSELMTPDFEQSCCFYESMFGWKLREVTGRNGSRYALVTSDNASEPFAGILTLKDSNIRAHWRSYVTVDNVKDTIDKAVKVGGSILVPETVIERIGTIAVIEDPCGAVFSVIEYNTRG